MDIRKLQRAIVDGLEDVKAHNIVVFNTEHLSPLFERVIIASGTSNRQTKALASSVRESVKEKGLNVLRTEGEENGEWIIVDCGAAVVHLMQPAIRDYYHLEELWGGKSVKMKLDAKPTELVKASPPAPAARTRATAHEASPAPRRSGAKPEAFKSAAAKKASARAPARKAGVYAAAKKAAAARAPGTAKASGAGRTGSARSAGAKRSAMSKTVVRKVAAKKSSARG